MHVGCTPNARETFNGCKVDTPNINKICTKCAGMLHKGCSKMQQIFSRTID